MDMIWKKWTYPEIACFRKVTINHSVDEIFGMSYMIFRHKFYKKLQYEYQKILYLNSSYVKYKFAYKIKFLVLQNVVSVKIV